MALRTGTGAAPGTVREAERARLAARALVGGEDTGAGAEPGFTRPEGWTEFDLEVRRGWSGHYPAPEDVPLEVRLCHPDGHVRASALLAPDAPLHLVAVRAADWAPPVRKRARQVLARALERDPAGTLGALTPLVLRLGRREQGGWAVELFEEALRGAGPAVLAALRAGADLPARRYATRLTLAAGGLGVRDLARGAAAERDPATARLWTDAALAALAAGGPEDGAVDLLLGGHVPMVRASGVTALRRAGRGAEAVDHLTDRSGLVRACARWLARQDGTDAHAALRPLVADPERVTPGAVTGFAECAGRADAPLFRALLEHRVGAVRAAAVAGLSRLEVSDFEALRPLLDDPSPAVAREVARALASSVSRLDPDELTDRTTAGRPVHTRRAAFRLLRARSGPAAARAAAGMLEDPDPGLRKLAQETLHTWEPWLPQTDEEEAEPASPGPQQQPSVRRFASFRLGPLLARLGITDRNPPASPDTHGR
ncbi:hypothetical protein OOK31_28465 [Streptomyces sp. NBC_00249]|uniref:hypothetical protein n=1 Tax=Streptomyces sp. NBC_00249 TaxID=2975690 RepID=UPI00224E959D|nr:hypothetical protein [Streptomyces sp. NBC_00249]MCX5197783.1 hypothetical protein [Streptomyces sp. NBC_00249]